MTYRSTREIITVEPLTPAIGIEMLASECIQLARDRHTKLRCRYNGVDLEFEAESDVVAMAQFYDEQKAAELAAKAEAEALAAKAQAEAEELEAQKAAEPANA